MRTTRNPRRQAAAAAAFSLLALAACSATGNSDEAGGSTDAAAEPVPAAVAGEDGVVRAAKDLSGGKTEAPDSNAQGRSVIATGQVTLVDEDLTRVRDDIDRLLGRYGGYVADETTTNDTSGKTNGSRLTLRVPYRSFGTVMKAFKVIATVKETRTKAEDVTTEVIDVDSRVRTQELSLERLRTFLRQTNDVNAMIRIESEIARREAELESTKAQQTYLEDQTSLGTIHVSLQSPKAAAKKEKKDETGFIPGLKDGWHAFATSARYTANTVGVLLPFAGALALVGFPLWVLVRRRVPAGAAPVEGPSS